MGLRVSWGLAMEGDIIVIEMRRVPGLVRIRTPYVLTSYRSIQI